MLFHDKKNVCLLLVLFLISAVQAQKQLWAYRVIYNYNNASEAGLNDGQILRVPLNGDGNPEAAFTFDTTGLQGKFPVGRLLQASNGKLYGVTTNNFTAGPGVPQGVLFEYDPVTDVYNVLNNTLDNPFAGVIEGETGVLYGTTDSGNTVFKYTIATSTYSVVGSIPKFYYTNGWYAPNFIGELTKASDGDLYGITSLAPSSQGVPFPGGIYRISVSTGQISKLYVFGSTEPGSDVAYPPAGAKLVEGVPGKLYGTALGGIHNSSPAPYPAPHGSGTLFEYTIETNTLSKKYDFDYDGIGMNPGPLVYAGNNTFYGTLYSINDNFPNRYGSVYQYNAGSETLSVLHVVNPAAGDYTRFLKGLSCKASDGNLYGSSEECLYQFDPASNGVVNKVPATYFGDLLEPIEICRKPNYHPFENTVSLCAGSTFFLDLHNVNATSFLWKRDNEVLASQTTGTLNLTNVAASDAGTYTCEMTNECGTTITAAFQVTVDCLGSPVLDREEQIVLYPNPVNDILQFRLPENGGFEIESYLIYNAIGQSVQTGKGNIRQVNVEQLSKGFYILKFQTNKGIRTAKFQKG